MINYQELTNRIKDTFSDDWLTPSQTKIYRKLINGYKTHKIINIYGKPGVGKTFLGWNLNEKFHPDSTYTKDIEASSAKSIVILDDYRYTKNEIRKLFPIMQFNNISKIFLITSSKAQDDIVSLELKFTENDRKAFKHNIFVNLCIKFEAEKPNWNMHNLIKNNL